MNPVFDPFLASGEVGRLLSLLPRYAQGPHDIVKHHPLHRPITRNGCKLSDQPACKPLSCRGSWHICCRGTDVAQSHAASSPQ